MTTTPKDKSRFPDEWVGKLVKTSDPHFCGQCYSHVCKVINNVGEICIRCNHVSVKIHYVEYTLVDRVLLTL